MVVNGLRIESVEKRQKVGDLVEFGIIINLYSNTPLQPLWHASQTIYAAQCIRGKKVVDQDRVVIWGHDMVQALQECKAMEEGGSRLFPLVRADNLGV